jgi:hypothetical protein
MANTPGSPDPRFARANNAWPLFRSLDSYRPRFLTRDLVAGLTLAAVSGRKRCFCCPSLSLLVGVLPVVLAVFLYREFRPDAPLPVRSAIGRPE